MLGSNIDKVGWPKCEIDILEYVGENQIFFTSLHRTVMEIQSTQKKQGLKILKKGIISMLWIGLKIK
jgi:hypothetical protein